jgi:RNA polymerase sigma factor (sigma-70 family)
MADASDMDLVREFAGQNSETAFAELVRRHISLVFSVALRFTGNPGDAEDVTQAVFIILARKAAGLSTRTVLTGWLYETTRYTASRLLRAQIRRQVREREASMQTILDEPGDNNLWSQLAPHLEAAMSRLGERDRTLLALRFYEYKTGAETATLLGIREEAAHKRTARALEKLRNFFEKRGITSTTAVIAETISANSIQPAPAALAKIVTAMALAKGATASTSTLTLIKGALKIMAWTKAKTAIVAVVAVILASGTGVFVVTKIHQTSKPVHLAEGALPQTLEELNAWYVEPPAGQNAATFNLEGFKAMQTKGADQIANLPILGKLPPPSPSAPLAALVKSALTDFVQRNREALQFFAQGAQRDQSRYPVDFTQGQKLQMPHLQEIKTGTQLAEMAAILDAEDHQGKQAADDVQVALALARSLNAEPMLISQMVREASIALAVAALEQVVNRTALPPESMSELQQSFQDMEKYQAQGKGLNRSLIGEKVMVMADFGQATIPDLVAAAAQDATEEQRQQMIRRLKQPGGLKDEKNYLESTFNPCLSGCHT